MCKRRLLTTLKTIQRMDVKEQELYWIYMLRLANGSYYTGYTSDLDRRFRAHRSGLGAKITRSFAPVAVAACWKLHSPKGMAMRIEAWIKSCTREKDYSGCCECGDFPCQFVEQFPVPVGKKVILRGRDPMTQRLPNPIRNGT